MRFIIYGAGAVGGTIGARLHQHGYDTVLIARGAHLEALRRDGLHFETPVEELRLKIPAVGGPAEVDWRDGDAAILTMKSQDTVGALEDLRHAAGDNVPVVCCQNGVANERMALRRFERVYGMMVWLPAVHLEPGIVQSNLAGKSGVLDVGRFPAGVDEVAREVASALTASNFVSLPDANVMRWKYAKLLSNLNNAVDALCGRAGETRDIARLARDEGIACYRAANIEWADPDEERERRAEIMQFGEVAGQPRAGGSTWQSLARGSRSVEVDFLNGEICQLGRTHDVPTPVNRVLQLLANRAAREGTAAGTFGADRLREAIAAAGVPVTA
jgi:2-dehydropantoate 2-reductase